MADRRGARRAAQLPGAGSERKLRAVAGVLSGSEAERLVFQRVRLGILSALAVNSRLTFPELKRLLDVTDGNLAVHARKLENAGLLECEKSFRGRLPRTEYRLTPQGRRALEKYLDHMESLLRATRGDT